MGHTQCKLVSSAYACPFGSFCMRIVCCVCARLADIPLLACGAAHILTAIYPSHMVHRSA